jgi:asparagine synthase (glutamine-hydrolysing)
MCGICGIVHHQIDYLVDQQSLLAMMYTLQHRGPDGEGTYLDGAVGLGHRRLAIIDLETGQQPMSNEDQSLWITYNGEIYNYRELRTELERRHVFATNSDTEVILHLYEEQGTACLERLNGMFAFAIWDRRERRLFAARDRLGIKPFYWHYDDENFIFASEIKALFAAGLHQPELDLGGLQENIIFQFCLGERTMFRDVFRLEPGCFLVLNAHRGEKPQIHRYWELQYQIDTARPEAEFIERLRYLLTDSVRLQLRADVPVGAHLSGGIDSSAVVCLASELTGNGFHSFTGAFDAGPEYDETSFARQVSEFARTIHHEIRPTAQDFIEVMPHLIYMMDEPAAGPGLFPQYFVSKLAQEHVKVVLGGQGGDELFGGYARYLVAYLEQVLKGVIYGTQEQGNFVVTWENIASNLDMLRSYQPLLQSFWKEGLFGAKDERYFRLVTRVESPTSLYTEEIWKPDDRDVMFRNFQEIFDHPSARSYFDQMTHFDIKTLLPALLQVEDRSSMSVSLESRVPLLDHRIVELLATMPPSIRFQGGDSKRIFREAVGSKLPGSIRNRHDKMGFPVPLNQWARGPLKSFLHDILLGSRARQRGFYQTDALEKLINSEIGFGRELWGLLCLELWLRAYMDGDYLNQELRIA